MGNVSQIERLCKAIEKLPEDGRQLMKALYFKGLSEQQVCVELNINHDELEARRSRSLQALMSAVH